MLPVMLSFFYTSTERKIMNELIAVLKDRYTAAELVELLDISIEDAIEHLYDIIESNPDVFDEEWRLLGYEK